MFDLLFRICMVAIIVAFLAFLGWIVNLGKVGRTEVNQFDGSISKMDKSDDDR